MEYYDIAIWRKKNNLTQAELAKRMGVTRTTVANWEAGKYRLPINLKAKLAALLEIPKEVTTPSTITPDTSGHWPQLNLYNKLRGMAGWTAGEEHPRRLVPALCQKDGPVSSSILSDPRYLEALKLSREGR